MNLFITNLLCNFCETELSEWIGRVRPHVSLNGFSKFLIFISSSLLILKLCIPAEDSLVLDLDLDLALFGVETIFPFLCSLILDDFLENVCKAGKTANHG